MPPHRIEGKHLDIFTDMNAVTESRINRILGEVKLGSPHDSEQGDTLLTRRRSK